MLKEMKWNVAYKLWKECSYSLPNTLNEPLSVKTIFTEYNQDGIDEIRSTKSTAAKKSQVFSNIIILIYLLSKIFRHQS